MIDKQVCLSYKVVEIQVGQTSLFDFRFMNNEFASLFDFRFMNNEFDVTKILKLLYYIKPCLTLDLGTMTLSTVS